MGDNRNTNDFKIQELVRILDATLCDLNPNGLSTGQNCLNIIKFISSFEGFDKFVSTELNDAMKREIVLSDGKQNVREHVKKILMYPRTTYLPWNDGNTKLIDELIT